MGPHRTRLLVLVTGDTLAPVRARRGDFGQMFRDGLLAGAGDEIDVEVVDCREREEDDALPDIGAFDGVAMTGSPAMVGEDAAWMRWSVRAILRALELEVPFLGVCFGHQLLGVALGADVGPNAHGREMGTVDVQLTPDEDDPLLSSMPRRFRAQVTHVDVIRAPGARLRVHGTSSHDPHHVVRAARLCWGVQFHPELDEASLKTYIEARHHLLDSEHGHGAADKRLQRLAPSDDAASILSRFARVCHDERLAAERDRRTHAR
jgi:GMP synthase (glutamine-hydrolysing)